METFKSDRKRQMQSECIPEFIVSRPAVISVAYTFKMAASNDGNNICTLVEEIQKYDCIYNKYSRDYKNKFIWMNCFQKIGEKFGISAEEAEIKYRHTRTGYGRWLKRKKNIHSGSGRDAVPKPPPEFQNLEWLDCHIKVVLHDPTFRATFRATALR